MVAVGTGYVPGVAAIILQLLYEQGRVAPGCWLLLKCQIKTMWLKLQEEVGSGPTSAPFSL